MKCTIQIKYRGYTIELNQDDMITYLIYDNEKDRYLDTGMLYYISECYKYIDNELDTY